MFIKRRAFFFLKCHQNVSSRTEFWVELAIFATYIVVSLLSSPSFFFVSFLLLSTLLKWYFYNRTHFFDHILDLSMNKLRRYTTSRCLNTIQVIKWNHFIRITYIIYINLNWPFTQFQVIICTMFTLECESEHLNIRTI